MNVSDILNIILRIIFPDRCAGCKKLGELFCPNCRMQLQAYPGRMRHIPPALDDVYIGYVFGGPLRNAIHTMKYHRKRRMAEPLGNLLTEALDASGLIADALVPIPMHKARLAERGFNQAAALAGQLGMMCGLPLLDSVERIRATEQQAHLNSVQRATNVQGAFLWRSEVPAPARILIIDDVLTTGATMNACAEALRRAGAERVYGLALARSRPELG